MKNLLKFTAVVAACTLVSCSNDFDELGSIDQPTAANELKIVAEEMGGGSLTRSAYVSESKNDRVWQETDKFQVFGPEIVGKYDYYKYKKSSNKFELDGTKDLSDASYVAFPAENVVGQNWVKEEGAGYIQFSIPRIINYDEVSGTSPVAYVSNLPLWGTAENDGEGIKAEVYFLTSIIKVYLTNALNNAKAVRIRAWNDIEGTDKAIINGMSTVKVSENNVALSPSNVQLATPEFPGDKYHPNEIIVDLGDLTGKATNSVVYIPLIAGYYGKVEVQYTDKALSPEFPVEADWHDIRDPYLDKDFKRATPYGNGNKKVFDVNVNSISGLNKILANMASSASGEVAIASQTTIENFDADLTVPAMNNVTELTLNTKFNAEGHNLTVEGDFAGKLVLNPAEGSKMGNVDIRTKNAKVVMGGDWSTSGSLTFTYAKDVQFGGLLDDKEDEIDVTFTNALTFGAAVEGVIVAEKAKVGALELGTNHKAAEVNVLGEAGKITVKESTLQNATAVKVAGKAGDIEIKGEKTAATVEVSGTAGSITNEGVGAITISGNPVYAASAADSKKVGAVSTYGDVTINLDNEGVAIVGGLTFNAAKTLTLTQGYVDAIHVNENVTCTLGNGYVTLPNPTIAKDKKFTVSNVPTWNGEIIGGSFDTDPEKNAIKEKFGLKDFPKIDWSSLKDAPAAVYTPIGLAMNAGVKDGFTLANDINLNNKDWTPVAAKGDINGNGKTISKLNVPALKDGSETTASVGRGLFTNIVKHTVKNLTLDGVTINAAPYKYKSDTKASVPCNIGALAGGIKEATIQLVTVNDLTITATGGVKNIGGIAGVAYRDDASTLTSTLIGVQLTGTNTINGYYNLGGLIGYAGADVKIQKCEKGTVVGGKIPAADVASAATVSFKANYNNPDATNDLKYLQVGNFIGSAATTAVIIITDAASVNPTLTHDKSTYKGTTLYQESKDGTTKSYDIVFDKQTLIGWCGDAKFDTAPRINDKEYQLETAKPDLDNLSANKQYWLYYINK